MGPRQSPVSLVTDRSWLGHQTTNSPTAAVTPAETIDGSNHVERFRLGLDLDLGLNDKLQGFLLIQLEGFLDTMACPPLKPFNYRCLGGSGFPCLDQQAQNWTGQFLRIDHHRPWPYPPLAFCQEESRHNFDALPGLNHRLIHGFTPSKAGLQRPSVEQAAPLPN